MSKIKILHIITRFDKGGSAKSVYNLVLGLDKERFDLTLISGPDNILYQDNIQLFMQSGIRYICIPELVRNINIIKDIKAFFKLYSFIKKERFDIVHTHTSKAGILGRWAARLARIKIIVHTPHGHIFYGYFNWLLSRIFIYLERVTAGITDAIIPLTEIEKQEYILYKIAKPAKFFPIFSGIDLNNFRLKKYDPLQVKKELNIPSGYLVIGTVTRLEPVKGNKYFIISLKKVIKAVSNLKVLIVGEGSQRKHLESLLKRYHLDNYVVFLGFRDDIDKIISSLDLFILSSLNEGMGMCLLEAQAKGVPVVATRVGGIPSVVKDGLTGRLVPAKDPQAMAEAIIYLLSDDLKRKAMAKEALNWIDERFSILTMIEKHTELYNMFLRERYAV
ncbi:MAG: glycosyltransferase family 4 protein [Candidatus Omnitrophica bacterium]|nr:glycosyltransferase family 4 protein [Candidatus Omnitrophota bacterium]